MKNLKNNVQLIGNIGLEPTVREFDSGSKQVSFSLATSEKYKGRDGKLVENTQWHNVVAWGPTAEYIEKYLAKGMRIAMSGKLNYRQYNDKDGNKKYITEIIADQIMQLSASKEEARDAKVKGDLPF